jgi:hypothetical protein
MLLLHPMHLIGIEVSDDVECIRRETDELF